MKGKRDGSEDEAVRENGKMWERGSRGFLAGGECGRRCGGRKWGGDSRQAGDGGRGREKGDWENEDGGGGE